MQNKVIYDNSGLNLSFKSYMTKVFVYVSLGLLVSTLVSFLVALNLETVFGVLGSFGTFGLLLPAILEIVVAIYFSSKLMSMKKSTAYICYFLYAVLTGLSFSTIFIIYAASDITYAFISTTVLFICMAVFGHNTSFDFSKTSSYLSAGLVAIIISTLINALIFKSSAFDLIISYVAIVIFLILIAYDTQMLRNLYNAGLSNGDLYEKLMIFGSFQLYLDFINIFLRLLQIFSRRRRD